MRETRLVPISSPKTSPEYPETQSLLPSSDTYWHDGFGTKPSQDIGHPLVWAHRSSIGAHVLSGMATDCEASALGEGYGQRHRTLMWGAWAMKRPAPTGTGKPNSAEARCDLLANGLLRNPSARLPTEFRL